MENVLTDIEVRVLGSLIEKEMATPEYYPMSLKALTNACNQKSNRDPVVSYDEKTVVKGLDGLKEKQLVTQGSFSRVPKYAHNFTGPRNLINREAALLCVLFLRGPQTIGELRGRTERLYEFTGLEEVGETIANLIDLGYVVKMDRQPGRKEHRYTHLLAGEPKETGEPARQARPEAARLEIQSENERIAKLEKELADLRRVVEELQTAFHEFKSQFE